MPPRKPAARSTKPRRTFPKGTAASAARSRPVFTEDHPNLRHPTTRPSSFGHVIHGLPQEARALLFVIYALACLMLAFSIIALFLASDELPRIEQPNAAVDASVREAPNAVPAT